MGGRDLEDILIDLEGDWDCVYVGWILLSLLILPCTVQYGINGIRTQYLGVESAWIRNAPGLVRAIDADPRTRFAIDRCVSYAESARGIKSNLQPELSNHINCPRYSLPAYMRCIHNCPVIRTTPPSPPPPTK